MPELIVQIVRFVDEAFPGWAEAQFVDAQGQRHSLIDKIPIFTGEYLWTDSKYPAAGSVGCEVLERYQDENGQEVLRISTEKPGFVESTKGLTEFVVPASLISSAAP
jgi:hypothetical protein